MQRKLGHGGEKWLFFGGDGVIAENLRYEQRKAIKYSQLAANMVILGFEVQWNVKPQFDQFNPSGSASTCQGGQSGALRRA